MSAAVRHRVLLVDDDPATRRLVGKVLQQAGYEVDFAEDGGVGLTKALARDYDLLVVDQEMPVHSGQELLHRLSQSGPLPPTIVLTGQGSEELAVESMKLGVCDYIRKTTPLALTEMLPLALARAMAQHELRAEKQRAETALRESQQLLLATLESTADGILAVTTDGKVLAHNRRFAEMWRIPQDVLQKGTDGALIQYVLDQLQDPDGFLTGIEQLTGSEGHGFDELQFKDGRVFERYSCPLTLDGKIVGRVWNFRDVTERHNVEQQLRKRTEELDKRLKELRCLFEVSRLFENCELSVGQIVLETLELIPAAFREPQAVSARCVLDGKIHQIAPYVETQWKIAAPIMEGNQLLGAIEVCYLYELPAGASNPFLEDEICLLNTLGEMLSQNIVRLRAEAQVRRLKQQIEYILAATNTSLTVIDANYRVCYVDPHWQQILGDPRGKKCYQYIMHSPRPCDDCGATKALASKEVVVSEHTIGTDDPRVFHVSSVPFQDDSGQWLVAEVWRDITELKQMERRLAQAQKLEAIGHLAAGIAHELNTPIQYVDHNIGFLRQVVAGVEKLLVRLEQLAACGEQSSNGSVRAAELERAIAETDIHFYVQEAHGAIAQSAEGLQQMAKIVQAMKEFGQHTGNDKQVIDINRTVQIASTACRSRWQEIAELKLELSSDLLCVACNPDDLSQVMLQLLDNAAQAIADAADANGKGKGTITVQTRQQGDWAEISVEDTGVGIAPEIQDKIFNPFFTTKDVGQGSGQGLSVVYAIVVQKYGGFVDFDTQPGKGTRFTIRLPLAKHGAVVLV